MPHMANLPWLSTYLLTMMITIFIFSNLKLSNTLKQQSSPMTLKPLNTKKWTW